MIFTMYHVLLKLDLELYLLIVFFRGNYDFYRGRARLKTSMKAPYLLHTPNKNGDLTKRKR